MAHRGGSDAHQLRDCGSRKEPYAAPKHERNHDGRDELVPMPDLHAGPREHEDGKEDRLFRLDEHTAELGAVAGQSRQRNAEGERRGLRREPETPGGPELATLAHAQLGKILKGGAIALAVDQFGPQINKGINSLTGDKNLAASDMATKVVPILSMPYSRRLFTGLDSSYLFKAVLCLSIIGSWFTVGWVSTARRQSVCPTIAIPFSDNNRSQFNLNPIVSVCSKSPSASSSRVSE